MIMNVGEKIAKQFNEEVLKGQLNPDGAALKKLAQMINDEFEDKLVDYHHIIMSSAHEWWLTIL